MSTLRIRHLSFAPLAGVLLLGGCAGFQPLYGAPGFTSKLAAIDVVRPDGRTGYLMGRDLEDNFSKNRTEAPVYRLTLATREVRIPRGIRVDNVASRYEVDLSTTYTLTEIATRKVVTAGTVKVNVTYDSADQPYAGLAAEQDGQARAAEQAAERIRLDLASFFASPRPTPAPTALSNVDIATYSERLQPAVVQSPRQRALSQPTAQSGATDVFGQPLQVRVIEGTTLQDWEATKAKDAYLAAMKSASANRAVDEDRQLTGWEGLYEQIARMYMTTSQRSLPQGKARYANEALYVVSEAMDTLYGDHPDETAERNLARTLERIGNNSDIPPAVLAFELERLRAWRKASLEV